MMAPSRFYFGSLTRIQIGAGVDSFFEYAFKAHILLSDTSGEIVNVSEGSSADFLSAWTSAHLGIKRHIYRGSSYEHPHYIQVDVNTGAARAFSIDSLSAFFPGLLTLAGQLEEAIETHLLFTAIWMRFSSLPERWSALSGNIEKGMGWWVGRPEFIESTWYLYRATQDPWYLHVGEMALRDIKRRCWTRCGWAGLRDVRTGEKGDRMESFFLGETIKYLFLLFDPKHPLNSLEASFVFTTEAHPLIVPKCANVPSAVARTTSSVLSTKSEQDDARSRSTRSKICPIPPKPVPLTYSVVASRKDLFHAAVLARLKLKPPKSVFASPLLDITVDHPSVSHADLQSPSNYSYYPWTLPQYLIPPKGTSSPMSSKATFDLFFPNLPNTPSGILNLVRVNDGLVINSVSGLRFSMVKERLASENAEEETFRVQTVSNTALGRDEIVYIPRHSIETFEASDPYFTQIRDSIMVDLLVESDPRNDDTDYVNINENSSGQEKSQADIQGRIAKLEDLIHEMIQLPEDEFTQAIEIAAKMGISIHDTTDVNLFALEKALPSLSDIIHPSRKGEINEEEVEQSEAQAEGVAETEDIMKPPITTHYSLPAYFSTGPGAAAIPDDQVPLGEEQGEYEGFDSTSLAWKTIYLSDETCTHRLPVSAPRDHQVIIMKRGGCTFSQKMQNIPSFAPSPRSLQMVVVVSFSARHHAAAADDDAAAATSNNIGDDDDDDQVEMQFIRPLLDKIQVTPAGIARPHPIPMIMVDGGEDVYNAVKRARSVGMKRRWHIFSQGLRISNVIIT